jgi:hypothetical protein
VTEHSQADYFLIFACGLTYILSREDAMALKNGPWRSVRGGDALRAEGPLAPDYDVSNTLRMPAKIEIVLESLFRISMPDSHLGKLRT